MPTHTSLLRPVKPRTLPLTMASGVVAARLDPALTQRTWSIGGQSQGRTCHIFLIAHGTATFHATDGSALDLSGPALLWLPKQSRGNFLLPAGVEGAMTSIAEDLVTRIASDSPVGQQLRGLLDRTAIAPSERISPRWTELSTIMTAMQRETRDQLPGGAAMLGLNLGLLLLHLWRAAGVEATASPRGGSRGTFQSFLQLVEIHYRENLTIEDFAALLGVSRAHLHEACLQTSGRTPLTLIHERQIEEAKTRLEQSDLSIEQVGFGLGFRDPGYFSRFFKRLTGQAPGAYRQARRQTSPNATPSFAAWP